MSQIVDPIVLTYTMDAGECERARGAAFFVRSGRHFGTVSAIVGFAAGALMITVGGALALTGQPDPDGPQLVICGPIIMGLAVMVIERGWRISRPLIKHDPVTLTFAPQGLELQSATRPPERISWFDVRGVERHKGFTLIFLDREFIAIPERLLQDPPALATWINFLLENSRHVHAAFPVLPAPPSKPATSDTSH